MAAISIDDCTVTPLAIGALKVLKIVTPATADDGDTIDVSTLFSSGCMGLVSAATDNATLSTAYWTAKSIVLTGSTDNEARTVIAIGK